MSNKAKYTGQDIKAETKTFEAGDMEHGLEPLQEDDYEYFFKVTGLKEKAGKKIKVLEVGCGSGPFGRRLAKTGYSVTGIDLSKTLVKAANNAARADGIKYRAVAGDVFKFRGKGYDIVLCAGFLHHFMDLKPILKKLKEFLKKGGHVVLIEPNGSNPALKITEWVRKNIWPFMTMKNLGTLNETSHPVERYIMEFTEAGYLADGMTGFIKKPRFDDYGAVMNIILTLKYFFHIFTAMFMNPEIRGSVIVMRFKR
jgi:2-polyprenyl-3-methyl-5-hydroxy-6-metoxy-1,4-benzoquinol methylase